MKAILLLVVLLLGVSNSSMADEPIPNRLIDFDTFFKATTAVGELRKTRRVTEEQFIALAKQPGTVIIDARSAEGYRLRHVQGAVNLSLPDFTEETLKAVIPSTSTTVLIYCNNNFLGSPRAFPTKRLGSSLNLPTFTALYDYGYTNVYELGPVIDIAQSKLVFEGEEVVTSPGIKNPLQQLVVNTTERLKAWEIPLSSWLIYPPL